jgi:hypothetical protein
MIRPSAGPYPAARRAETAILRAALTHSGKTATIPFATWKLPMPAPAADRAILSFAAAPQQVRTGAGGPYINPATGLSTDYLNHFAEVVMVLEMSSTSPECLADLREWQPRTYPEHFARTRFSNRDQVIAAYWTADPVVREAIDQAAETLNDALVKIRDIVLRQRAKPETTKAVDWSLTWLKPLISRTAAVINGTAPDFAQRQGTQVAIDAIFET